MTDTKRKDVLEEIPFTQYLMPHGRTTNVTIRRPPGIAARAREVIASGLHFECEMLSDYKTVSLTVADRGEGEDLDIELAPNGPEVPKAVDRLVQRAHKNLCARALLPDNGDEE